MLIDFSIANFRSIKEEQTLSLSATSLKEHPKAVFKTWEGLPILKTAVLYGANGSGKSNLLEGLRCMLSLVEKGHLPNACAKFYRPFRLDRHCQTRPTVCELEFADALGVRYRYRLAFRASGILEEALYSYPKKQEVRLFSRTAQEPMIFGEQLKGSKKSIERNLLPQQLFLSTAKSLGHPQLSEVWMALQYLVVASTSDTQELVSEALRQVSSWSDHRLHHYMSTLLHHADTGVKRVVLKEIPQPETPWKRQYLPLASHPVYENGIEVGEEFFDFLDESKGTQRIYGLGAALFTALEKGQTIIIDELDSSFHPLMTAYLVQLFYDPAINKHNAQLIFSTHDTSMLQHRLFRRDQIWFAEKDQFGATSLYGLSEFNLDKVRANTPFDKWYLSGRFGALPLLLEFSDELGQATDEELPEGAETPYSKGAGGHRAQSDAQPLPLSH